MIVIIDYGLGNLASVANALDKLKIPNRISSSKDIIQKANSLILPGVGAAGEGMKKLKLSGLNQVIISQINQGKPILGICLGMQLLFEWSEEGNIKCLGILKGKVVKFRRERKVPQIGWNDIKVKNQKLKVKYLFKNIPDNSYFYFVNSYYCSPDDNSIIAAETEYGEKFPSVIIKDNISATQFHPEKSGQNGLILLNNFFKFYANNSGN